METCRHERRRPAGSCRATAAAGFTLVEACITLGLLAVLAFSAAPGLSGLLETRRLHGAAGQLATDIQYVRSLAVARNQTVRLSFPGGSAPCYVIHTGSPLQCTCGGSGPAQCSGGVELKTVTWGAGTIAIQANTASIVFDPVHGTSTPAGTLRVIAPSGRAIHHVVNVMGRVRSCSPGALVAGHPAC